MKTLFIKWLKATSDGLAVKCSGNYENEGARLGFVYKHESGIHFKISEIVFDDDDVTYTLDYHGYYLSNPVRDASCDLYELIMYDDIELVEDESELKRLRNESAWT